MGVYRDLIIFFLIAFVLLCIGLLYNKYQPYSVSLSPSEEDGECPINEGTIRVNEGRVEMAIIAKPCSLSLDEQCTVKWATIGGSSYKISTPIFTSYRCWNDGDYSLNS